MGRLSTIRQLPSEIRGALDRWLHEGAITQAEAAARVNAQLAALGPGRAPVSRNAVGRYHRSTRGLGRWRKESREIAAQIGRGTAEAARAAGKAMGRLIASRLPVEVRMHCVAALAEELWGRAAKCSSKHRAEGEFRAQALRDVDALMRGEGLSFLKAARRVATKTGRSVSVIRDWHYGRKGGERGARDFAPQDRAAALIPRHANAGRPRKEFLEEMGRLFKTLDGDKRKPTVADSYRRVRKAAEAVGLDMDAMPSLRTVQSRVKEGSRAVRVYRREGPQAVVKKVPKLRIDRSALKVGEAVSGDGLMLDRIRVEFEDGEVRSPTVWIFQDEKSRYVAAYAIGKTESTTLFRHAMQDLADKFLPKRMTLDNTMVAANKAMTGGAKGRKRFKDHPGDPNGLLLRLGIEPHWTNPDRRTMNPGAKLCERAFGIGGLHSEVEFHPRIRHLGRTKDRPVPWGEFRAAFAEAVQDFNRRQGRRDRDSVGRSYEKAFREGMADPANPVRKANPYQREMLRRVPKRERVRADQWEVDVRIARGDRGVLRYVSPDLEPWMCREVIVLFNPDDTAEDALVEDLEGRRICRAERLADAAYGSTEAAGDIQRLKNRRLKAVREAAAAEGLMSEKELAGWFPPETVGPTPEPAVLTSDFDSPPTKAAPAGGGPDSSWMSESLDELAYQQGLEYFEQNRTDRKDRNGRRIDE